MGRQAEADEVWRVLVSACAQDWGHDADVVLQAAGPAARVEVRRHVADEGREGRRATRAHPLGKLEQDRKVAVRAVGAVGRQSKAAGAYAPQHARAGQPLFRHGGSCPIGPKARQQGLRAALCYGAEGCGGAREIGRVFREGPKPEGNGAVRPEECEPDDQIRVVQLPVSVADRLQMVPEPGWRRRKAPDERAANPLQLFPRGAQRRPRRRRTITSWERARLQNSRTSTGSTTRCTTISASEARPHYALLEPRSPSGPTPRCSVESLTCPTQPFRSRPMRMRTPLTPPASSSSSSSSRKSLPASSSSSSSSKGQASPSTWWRTSSRMLPGRSGTLERMHPSI